MVKNFSTVAIYPSQTVKDAVKDLMQSGFDMKRLSIAGRDLHPDEKVVGYYSIGNRMKMWGETGAFWSGLWGMLLRSGIFWLPDLGPILVAGPLVGWMVGVLEGALVVDGLSVFGTGLYSLGIPVESIKGYEAALAADKVVLIASGSVDDTSYANKILHRTEPEALEFHQ